MDWHLLMSTSDLYRRLLPRAGIAPSALGTSRWSAWSAHVSLCSSGLWAMGGESREGAGAARSPATTGHVASNPWRGACLLRPCAGTGKSRLGGCSSLPGSQPLCKESLEVCMGYTRGTSSPPLSQPVSFSLSLRVIKGSYFRDTSSTTSLSTESIANHSPRPLSAPAPWPPCVLLSLHPAPSSPKYPHLLLSSQSLLSCRLLNMAFLTLYLNWQPPSSTLALTVCLALFGSLKHASVPTRSVFSWFSCSRSVSTHQAVVRFFTHCFFFSA